MSLNWEILESQRYLVYGHHLAELQKTWKILSRATYPGAPSYDGVRTLVESSQARKNRALAEASNLLGCKEYNCLSQAFLNCYTDYTFTKKNIAVEH